jgi:hypothetical protein
MTDLPELTVVDTVVIDDDGKIDCDACGGRFTKNRDGSIRRHKCADGITTVSNVKGTRVSRKGGKKHAPDAVRKLGVAVIASGVEWSADAVISRAVPCEPADVPSELPDADAMVGPIVDALWPQIPPAAQSALIRIADQSDLIACVFMWMEYGRTLKVWTETARNARIEQEKANNGSIRGQDVGPVNVGVYESPEPDPTLFKVADSFN